ncbi:uncharacterized protein LOC121428902 [Lytechinus variegatus]|uniref:uncharacterized protein LOC121428902 n=1 Tax=Lytechinus variegatus TaxID=7654 RepID=UPI001BB137F4|nr:uncharacterized protein LOC121428902 [Lytechinus variegatus]
MMQEMFPQFEEGTRVNGLGQLWTLGRVLGMGRCAKVYHMSTDQESFQAAVKVYRKEEKYRLAFIKEMCNLNAVYGDRRVITVYGTFTHKGHPCLAMELLDFNLKEFIYRSENCQVFLSSIPTNSIHSKKHSKAVSNIACNNNNNETTSSTVNHRDNKKRKGQSNIETVTTASSGRSRGRVKLTGHTVGDARDEHRMQTRRATAQRAADLRSKNKDSDLDSSTTNIPNTGQTSRTHSGSLKHIKRDLAEDNDDGDNEEGDDVDDHSEDDEGRSEELDQEEEDEDEDEDASSYGLSLYLIQQLLKDIASCLEFVQRCGWVHGDLKPANILWSSQEGSWKIVDFGHSFQEGRQDFSQIQSLCYQSPEAKVWNSFVSSLGNQKVVHKMSAVDEGISECTHAADIWSVGCVIVRAYTGMKLYGQDDVLPGACLQCQKSCSSTVCVCEPLIEALFKPKMTNPKLSSIHQAAVHHLVDLVKSMLQCDITKRPSASEILNHPFFSNELTPSAKDLLLLPMRTLRLSNLASPSVDLTNQKIFQALYQDIKRECLKFGPIKTLIIPRVGPVKGTAFIEYEDSANAKSALNALIGQKLFNQPVHISFFPVADFTAKRFY